GTPATPSVTSLSSTPRRTRTRYRTTTAGDCARQEAMWGDAVSAHPRPPTAVHAARGSRALARPSKVSLTGVVGPSPAVADRLDEPPSEPAPARRFHPRPVRALPIG